MLERLLSDGYWFMFIQVVTTTWFMPMMLFVRLRNASNSYCREHAISAFDEVSSLLAGRYLMLKVLALLSLILGLVVVGHAYLSQTELFNWDNQAGLVVLFFIALIPGLWISKVQSEVIDTIFANSGSTRTASLVATPWTSYVSKTLIALLALGQLVFAVSVVYFVSNPFSGFAGYTNLFGLVVINLIFLAVCYFALTHKKLSAIEDPGHRHLLKVKNLRFNLIAWTVAVFYLSLSLWLSGLALKDYALLLQSFYFQFVVFLTLFTIALPNSDQSESGLETNVLR